MMSTVLSPTRANRQRSLSTRDKRVAAALILAVLVCAIAYAVWKATRPEVLPVGASLPRLESNQQKANGSWTAVPTYARW